MAKYSHPDVLDASLNEVATAERMIACSDQPADYASVAALLLADVAMAPEDFTIGPGASSGRRVTMAEKPGVAVTTAGNVNHVALVDDTAEKLLYVTTADNQQITDGSFVDFPEWSIEIADPA